MKKEGGRGRGQGVVGEAKEEEGRLGRLRREKIVGGGAKQSDLLEVYMKKEKTSKKQREFYSLRIFFVSFINSTRRFVR